MLEKPVAPPESSNIGVAFAILLGISSGALTGILLSFIKVYISERIEEGKLELALTQIK
jgi:hypothetical protein